MAEETPNLSPLDTQPRPRPRRVAREAENERPESGQETSNPQQEVGDSSKTERKKPRKLERRSVQIEDIQTPPSRTLNNRVETLESQIQALNTRVDRVELRTAQSRRTFRRAPSSARSTTARSTSASTRAQQRPIPSLADQLRETHSRRRRPPPVTADSVEELPRHDTLAKYNDRQVQLTGQYAIPLPASLSTQDIRNLRSGVAAAGSVVRAMASALSSGNVPTSTQEGGSGTTASGESGVQGSAKAAARGDRGKESEEGIFGGDGISPSVKTPGPTAGNQRPDINVSTPIAEGAKSWKGFIADLGTVVASAAKDAAVEVRGANVAPATPGGMRDSARTGTSYGGGDAGGKRPKAASRTSSKSSSRR